MKVGVIGVGAVGSAATMALVARGCAREIVLVDQDTARAHGVALDMDYGLPLLPPVDLNAGGAVVARLAEAVLRDEQALFTVAAHDQDRRVTLSLLSALGAEGVSHTYLPAMTDAEEQALERSAETLRQATATII